MKKEWQPTPVVLPGEFLGQKILVGYSPRECKESDVTEWLTLTVNLYEDFQQHLFPNPHIVQGSALVLDDTYFDSFWVKFIISQHKESTLHTYITTAKQFKGNNPST